MWSIHPCCQAILLLLGVVGLILGSPAHDVVKEGSSLSTESESASKSLDMEKTPRNTMVYLYQYRYVIGDDFVLSTISPSPLNKYVYNATLGQCWSGPATGTVPLFEYTWVKAGATLHWYTTTWNESGLTPASFIGIPCYLWAQPDDGSLPFYRFYNYYTGAHFYSLNQIPPNAQGYVYNLELIQGYLLN